MASFPFLFFLVVARPPSVPHHFFVPPSHSVNQASLAPLPPKIFVTNPVNLLMVLLDGFGFPPPSHHFFGLPPRTLCTHPPCNFPPSVRLFFFSQTFFTLFPVSVFFFPFTQPTTTLTFFLEGPGFEVFCVISRPLHPSYWT